MEGRPVRVKSSIDEGLEMLDAFAAFAAQNADSRCRSSILAVVDDARETLTARLGEISR